MHGSRPNAGIETSGFYNARTPDSRFRSFTAVTNHDSRVNNATSDDFDKTKFMYLL